VGDITHVSKFKLALLENDTVLSFSVKLVINLRKC